MWVWPIGRQGGLTPVISDNWHQRGDVFHAGVDLGYKRPENIPVMSPWSTRGYYTPPGTQAFSIGDGVVTISKDIGTGGYVQVDHGNGMLSQYMHLSSRNVAVGQSVSAGQTVGIVGFNPNDPEFAHLHFELLVDGQKVDPEPYLNSWTMIAQGSLHTAPSVFTSMAVAGVFAFGLLYLFDNYRARVGLI